MPGMYAVTSIPFVKRTRATLRSAEFGFLGVAVYTRVQTPRFCGHSFKAGESDLHTKVLRPLRTNWIIYRSDITKTSEARRLRQLLL